MATVRDIVTDAMKLARVIASGESPTSDEAADGLTAFQSMIDCWVTGGTFGTLRDVRLTADTTAQEGRRYYVPAGLTLTDATNDYTPDCPDSYTECDYGSGTGIVRQPRDLAIYESLTSTGIRSVKLYDRAAWVELTGLDLNSEAPMSSRNRTGLAACLATYGGFCAMFGDTATLNPDIRRLAATFLGNIASKIGSTQDDPGGIYF